MSSLSQCVASAKLELKIESTIYDAWMMKVAQEAVRKFDCRDIYVKKQECLKLNSNGAVCLPEDFFKVLAIFGQIEPSQQPCNPLSGQPNPPISPLNLGWGMAVYVDQPFLKDCGIFTSYNGVFTGDYQINGDKLQFFGAYNQLTTLTLCYLAYHMVNGEMVVKDEWEEAVMYHICYRWARRESRSPYLIKNFQQEWVAKYNKVKSMSHIMRFQNMKPQMLELMNAMLVDKNIFYSL